MELFPKQSFRPAILIKRVKAKQKSKFGGFPNLPRNVKWPVNPQGRQLDFLAQLHCPDLPKGFGLPEEGMLFFFYDFQENPSGWGKHDNEYFSVVYSPFEFTETTRSQRHKGYATISDECFLKFKAFQSPKLDVWSHLKSPFHQMFGYPVWVQDDEQRRGEILLLQLDSDSGPGWMWGDVGILYFFIKENDFKEGNFSKIRLCMQCC